MADVTFTLGADDRDVTRALSRIDRGVDRTAKSFGNAFRFGVIQQGIQRATANGVQAMDAYARSSDYAAERVANLNRGFDSLRSSIGEGLVSAFEGIMPYLTAFEEWRKRQVNGLASLFAMLTGEDISEIDARRADDERAFREGRSRDRAKDIGDDLAIQILRLQDQRLDADLLAAERDRRRRQRDIGQDKTLTDDDRRALQEQSRLLYEAQVDAARREQRKRDEQNTPRRERSEFRFGDAQSGFSGSNLEQIFGTEINRRNTGVIYPERAAEQTADSTKKIADASTQLVNLVRTIAGRTTSVATFA